MQLRDIPELSALTRLQRIDLSQNPFVKFSDSALILVASQITYLRYEGTVMLNTLFPSLSVAAMVNLKRLWMNQNFAGPVPDLSNMKSLEFCDIQQNPGMCIDYVNPQDFLDAQPRICLNGISSLIVCSGTTKVFPRKTVSDPITSRNSNPSDPQPPSTVTQVVTLPGGENPTTVGNSLPSLPGPNPNPSQTINVPSNSIKTPPNSTQAGPGSSDIASNQPQPTSGGINSGGGNDASSLIVPVSIAVILIVILFPTIAFFLGRSRQRAKQAKKAVADEETGSSENGPPTDTADHTSDDDGASSLTRSVSLRPLKSTMDFPVPSSDGDSGSARGLFDNIPQNLYEEKSIGILARNPVGSALFDGIGDEAIGVGVLTASIAGSRDEKVAPTLIVGTDRPAPRSDPGDTPMRPNPSRTLSTPIDDVSSSSTLSPNRLLTPSGKPLRRRVVLNVRGMSTSSAVSSIITSPSIIVSSPSLEDDTPAVLLGCRRNAASIAPTRTLSSSSKVSNASSTDLLLPPPVNYTPGITGTPVRRRTTTALRRRPKPPKSAIRANSSTDAAQVVVSADSGQTNSTLLDPNSRPEVYRPRRSPDSATSTHSSTSLGKHVMTASTMFGEPEEMEDEDEALDPIIASGIMMSASPEPSNEEMSVSDGIKERDELHEEDVEPSQGKSLLAADESEAEIENVENVDVVGKPEEWTVDEVVMYLTRMGLPDIVAVTFRDHSINGQTLLQLTSEDLESELGIPATLELPANLDGPDTAVATMTLDVHATVMSLLNALKTLQTEAEAALAAGIGEGVEGGEDERNGLVPPQVWECERVCSWLSDVVGVSEDVVERFRVNNVDGPRVLNLTVNEMRQALGILPFGVRINIHKAVLALRRGDPLATIRLPNDVLPNVTPAAGTAGADRAPPPYMV
ncbi:hypothetical protein HDU97_001602 [Phlyctochytrium planicorne]|nr:hypothetical protein HDU97_001602 [Phlyctochytrium planicorne]